MGLGPLGLGGGQALPARPRPPPPGDGQEDQGAFKQLGQDPPSSFTSPWPSFWRFLGLPGTTPGGTFKEVRVTSLSLARSE